MTKRENSISLTSWNSSLFKYCPLYQTCHAATFKPEISDLPGCIIFGSDQEVAELMKAVRRRNASGSFSWIGSDGWSARSLVSDGNEAEVEGTLSVQPQANPVKGFKDYFLSLTVENNLRNPWFVGKFLQTFLISENIFKSCCCQKVKFWKLK